MGFTSRDFPAALSEQSDEALKEEQKRRKKLRKKGLCTYCERPIGVRPGEPSCKFPTRHAGDK